MDRRTFLAATGSGLALPWLRTAAQEVRVSHPSPAPHVIYVFSDTHRWCSMDFTETPAVATPQMRAMKEQGVSFSNCYSTLPICSPYRAILMTGRWPWQQGFIANHMSLAHRPDAGGLRHTTLGWMFRDAGYATHYVGKWHLGKAELATECGFDTATLWGGEDHTVMAYNPFGAGNPFRGPGPHRWHKDPRYTGSRGDAGFPYKIIGETDQALLLLERHVREAPDRPLFLMLSLQDPHSPFRKNGRPTYPPHIREHYAFRDPLPFRANDRVRDQRFVSDYHACVTAVDEQLGRVREALRRLGVADNTVLLYSSDHGGLGGAQGVRGGQKRWPHDESSRVPLLVEWPDGIPPAARNRETDALISTIDLFPTLCSLAGLDARLQAAGKQASLTYLRGCPGVDHARTVAGDADAPDPPSIFICHPSNMNNKSPACPVHRTVVTKTHMYSVKGATRLGNRERWREWDTDGAGPWRLYDRAADPHQLTNLVDSPQHAAIRAELHRELSGWLDRAERPFVKRWFADHPHAGRWEREHDGEGIEAAFAL